MTTWREGDEPIELVHVFCGHARVGSLDEAAKALGVQTHVYDKNIDAVRGDVCNEHTRAKLRCRAAASTAATVWWLGIPCSSYSRVRGKGDKGPPVVRSREHLEGLPEVLQEYGLYLEKHNNFTRLSTELASIAWRAGATVVVENPSDRGDPDSSLFRWDARRAPSIWLTDAMQRWKVETGASEIDFPQCAVGSRFQKWTRLLTAGPRAHRLQCLSRLECAHAKHASRAQGFRPDGTAHSAAAATYPPLMCGVVAALLFTSISEAVVLGSPGADDVLGSLREQGDKDQAPAPRVLAAPSISWSASPDLIPKHWEEAADAEGDRFEERRHAALKYVSRRRMEAESPEVLLARPLPAPSIPPDTQAQEHHPQVPWPAEAPQRPIRVEQLMPETLGAFCEALDEAVASCSASEGTQWKRFETREFDHQDMPSWARGLVWDIRDPMDCVPLQPFTEGDPVQHGLSADFFQHWAATIGGVDDDMLRQAAVSGAESRAKCEYVSVIMGHHAGLRHNPAPAIASVEADTKAGWIKRGTRLPPTLPCRMIAKNMIEQLKWKIDDGVLKQVGKHRVTTDESADTGSTVSRNHALDREAWQDAGQPGPRTLGECVAIVRAGAARMGRHLRELELERIALWALDLCDAYRMLGAQRSEWWLQCFVWYDGVRLDQRAVFGSAHLPGLFQRITSFVLTIARLRVRAYDSMHPYAEARRAWQKVRAELVPSAQKRADAAAATTSSSPCAAAWPEADDAFADGIYLDDAFGETVLAPGAPLRGVATGSPKVSTLMEVGKGGRVKLWIFGDMSRPEIHLEIHTLTFEEAGWRIQRPKTQLDFEIGLLGVGVSSVGEGANFVPEAKRRGMLQDIEQQLEPNPKAVVVCSRKQVERLTGQCGHIAIVAAEGNAFLSPMWKVACATRKQQLPNGRVRRVRPSRLNVGGESATVQEYQRALRWWHAALSAGVRVPLAPRLVFPSLREKNVAYFFSDAAREAGTGFGAFTFVEWTRDHRKEVEFLFLNERWPEHLLRALQQDDLSMAAGELFGDVAMAVALAVKLPSLTHIVCFTDSSAAMGAINSGNSPSLQLNSMVQWLTQRLPGIQILAVHQPGDRNIRADGISRSKANEVVQDAERSGAAPRRLGVAPATWAAAERALLAPQRGC